MAGRRSGPGAPRPAPTASWTRPQVHDSVEGAVADLHRVFATCPRPRHVVKPLMTAREAAGAIREAAGRALRTGVLFGSRC